MVSLAPETTSMRTNVRELMRMFGGIARQTPLPLFGLLALIIIGNSRTALYVAATGGITQALIDQNRERAIVWAIVFLAASLIEQLYWPFKNHLTSMINDTAAVTLQTRVLRRAATVPLELFEHAPFFNKLQRANDDLGRRATLVIAQFIDFLQVVIMFISILLPIWLIDPRVVGLVVLGCLPIFWTSWRTATVQHAVQTRNAPNELYVSKLGDLMLNRDAAAELRLLGTGPKLVERWLGRRRRIADESIAATATIARGQLMGEVFVGLGLGGAIALLVQRIIEGAAPIGSLAAFIVAVTWAVGMVTGIAMVVRLLRENLTYLGDIFLFEEASERWARASESIVAPVAGPMNVELQNVSFRYPDTDRDVVRDLSLKIAPGEHIALLGENGAGKTTLVRLIAGLYAPRSGEIQQDGSTATSQRSDIGAVFQDFVRWQLPLRDNVAFGDLSRRTDDDAIVAALERADLADLPAELDGGLDAWLGREFGDRDLSGGQWQRLAIARAFFRDARLLILDEPTAALDPLAEQRLFERFRDLAAGKTAITIGHRIGSARTADRIIVMEAGQIIEQGTHHELMAKNGAYAAMFRSQQEWYKQEDEPPTDSE